MTTEPNPARRPSVPPVPRTGDEGLSPTVKRFLIVAIVCFVAGLLLLVYSLRSVVTDAGNAYP